MPLLKIEVGVFVMWPMQKGISGYALIDNLWTEFGSISWKKEEFFSLPNKS